MKKILFICFALITTISCKESKNDKTTSQEVTTQVESTTTKDETTLIEGNFVYYADAAVLQTRSSVFGVLINTVSEDLAKQAKPFQKINTDMVKVRVKALIQPKDPNVEGWDYNLDIKEIISVKALNASNNEAIKVGN